VLRSFKGGTDYTLLTTLSSSYYNTTAPTWMSWRSAACTTATEALCEIPIEAFACPQ
jgi:hypothetical protein